MTELCRKHQLSAAPDGKCVLCRRPERSPFSVREPEAESLASRLLTYALALGLVTTLAVMVRGLLAPSTGPSAPSNAAAAGQIPSRAQAPPSAPETDVQTHAETAPTALGRSEETPMLSYEELREARRGVRVTMYAAPWCYICDRSRDFLLGRDVQLREYDVANDDAAATRLARLNPSTSLPVFLIEDDVMIGFHPWKLEDAIDAAAMTQ
ncbi:MAG: glutaredoxin family protein [Myxococcales bacterium]|nr:glutaredoxin family protein [Myxococcales bacterium]